MGTDGGLAGENVEAALTAWAASPMRAAAAEVNFMTNNISRRESSKEGWLDYRQMKSVSNKNYPSPPGVQRRERRILVISSSKGARSSAPTGQKQDII